MSYKKFEHPPLQVPLIEGSRLTPPWSMWYSRVSNLLTTIEIYEETINPTSVAANTTAEQAFTVSGIGSEDYCVVVTKPTHTAGLGIVGWRVSDTDEISITFSNNTGSPIDPPSESYTFIILRG